MDIVTIHAHEVSPGGPLVLASGDVAKLRKYSGHVKLRRYRPVLTAQELTRIYFRELKRSHPHVRVEWYSPTGRWFKTYGAGVGGTA